MKKLSLCVLILGVLSVVGYYGTREVATHYFYVGVQTQTESFVKCAKDDNSKDYFPEYFKSCSRLCNSLYQTKALCVSSINGGSVTCVCGQ